MSLLSNSVMKINDDEDYRPESNVPIRTTNTPSESPIDDPNSDVNTTMDGMVGSVLGCIRLQSIPCHLEPK